MITIPNCLNLNAAQHLKMVLESAGIPSFIPDETMAAVAPFQFFTASGVRLQVAEEHVEEARQIVKEQGELS